MKSRSVLEPSNETPSVTRKLSKSENTPNSFLDNVKPMLVILRIFGRFPYSISGNEIQPFLITSPVAVYSIIIFIISLYLAINMLEVLTARLANSESYKDSLMSIMAISYLTHYPLIPLTDWLIAPTMIQYINLWHRYECQFNEELDRFSNKYLIPSLSYFTWPVGIYITYYSTYELCGHNFLVSMIYFPLVYGLYQYGLLWIFCQTYLVRQIRKLKEIIKSEGLQNRVERTRKCWLLLSELVSSTGYSTGIVMTSISMTAFLALIINCYGFFTSLLDSEGPVEWQMGSMALMHSLIFFFHLENADKTMNEVGKNFYTVIFEQKFSQLDEENLNQLVLLLTTFSLHPPIVHAAGLSVVNRSLFVSFLRNTLTYMIVLVQFKR